MKEIQVSIGQTLDSAIAELLKWSPAYCDFNGVRLETKEHVHTENDGERWRYTEGLKRYYNDECERRAMAWRESPEGQATLAAQEADRARLQRFADFEMALLQKIDFGSCDAVLAWVSRMAEPVDRIGVTIDRDEMKRVFVEHGWLVGANVGEAFKEDDERNVAGYIVGQFLECGHPIVTMFIDKWLAKFRPGFVRQASDTPTPHA